MILTILKFTRWLYKTLNSDLFAWQIGLGFTVGALAGLLPLGLGTVGVFTVIILVNMHFGSAMFAFGLFRLIGWALQGPLIRPTGAWALDIVPHGPVIAAAQTPIVSWFRFDYHDVAGAITVWMIIAIPLFVGMTLIWRKYREGMQKKLQKSKFMKWASSFWIFKGVKYVFVGN